MLFVGLETWGFYKRASSIGLLPSWRFSAPHKMAGRDKHDIRNRLVLFDGRAPSTAMPFEGTRISMVLLPRTSADQILPGLMKAFADQGVRLPREEAASNLGN